MTKFTYTPTGTGAGTPVGSLAQLAETRDLVQTLTDTIASNGDDGDRVDTLKELSKAKSFESVV